jgi:predicted nucleic acid-binding OB-fold protein
MRMMGFNYTFADLEQGTRSKLVDVVAQIVREKVTFVD